MIRKFVQYTRRGFTIVEIITVIVALSVLATITVTSFTSQQIKARDTAREVRASSIASALEKYFDTNGEYPSPRALTNNFTENTGEAVSSLLSLSDASILLMPNTPTGKTNSIVSSMGTEDAIAYEASSAVGNENCQTSPTGGCDSFTLSYKKESDNTIVTIKSRN